MGYAEKPEAIKESLCGQKSKLEIRDTLMAIHIVPKKGGIWEVQILTPKRVSRKFSQKSEILKSISKKFPSKKEAIAYAKKMPIVKDENRGIIIHETRPTKVSLIGFNNPSKKISRRM